MCTLYTCPMTGAALGSRVPSAEGGAGPALWHGRTSNVAACGATYGANQLSYVAACPAAGGAIRAADLVCRGRPLSLETPRPRRLHLIAPCAADGIAPGRAHPSSLWAKVASVTFRVKDLHVRPQSRRRCGKSRQTPFCSRCRSSGPRRGPKPRAERCMLDATCT
jgi:hypothetical protein